MAEFYKYDVIFGEISVEVKGSVQSGFRPCVVIQNDVGNKYSPTLLVLPMTKKIKHVDQPTHIVVKSDEFNGLREDSMILAEQTTTINKRKARKLGRIKDRDLQKAIFKCFIHAAAYGEDDEDLKELNFA